LFHHLNRLIQVLLKQQTAALTIRVSHHTMRRDYLLLTGLALLLFFPFLGGVHLFDWDEINFAECAREMHLTGDWFRPQIDFKPFWEKPPLFLWMQALSMSVFGVSEFAARFPNAICGLATLLLVFRIGSKLYDRSFGWLWALAWLGSLLPHLYFKTGIIDPWFNLFIFLGLYGFIEFRWQFFTKKKDAGLWGRYKYLILGGLCLGLAILTKGPTAYLIAMLVLFGYWAMYRFKNRGYFNHLLLFSVASFMAPLIWFGLECGLHGTWFIQEFIAYQIRLFATPDSGHGGFWGYHVVVLLIGCFPVSLFALPNLWGDRQCEEEMLESNTLAACKRSDFATWMQLLFWVVLVLFSIVQTKIVHYSSLCYFPLTFLGALTIWRSMHWKNTPMWNTWLIPVLGTILGLAVAAVPFLGMHTDLLKPLFKADPFAAANLDANVIWEWWQGLGGLILAAGSIAGFVYWRRNQAWLSAQIIFASGAAFMAATLIGIVPNIEGYSQRAAIDFYQSKAKEDCFIRPVGFKSYAHLFYSDKQPILVHPELDQYDSLAYGLNLPKKVFFIAKVSNLADLPNLPGCHELYRKNGFVFFERVSGQ
jgi:4-amino-4-deoxy-L-arabinose transferase-like glycosyltransferase